MHVLNTLSLDMGHVQSFFQTQNNSTVLEVKGITEEKHMNKRWTSAVDGDEPWHAALHIDTRLKDRDRFTTCSISTSNSKTLIDHCCSYLLNGK